MKNVVILFEEKGIADSLMGKLQTYLSEDDTLFVVYELQNLNASSIPMIGDLSEIRLLKAKRLIDAWFEEANLKVKTFVPIIVERKIQLKLIKNNLPLENNKKLDIISQTNSIHKWKKAIDTSGNGIAVELIEVMEK